MKRCLDVSVSVALVLILSPLLVLIAVAVRLRSEGPSLYRQERIGRDGNPFMINKFRTMTVDNDASEHREFVQAMLRDTSTRPAADGTYKLLDSRVTSLGALLRSYSLDELPQLWNVICGDMSLVGPRPALSWECEMFSPYHQQRNRALPGCTGLWQVSGRSLLSTSEMLDLDVEYVQTWSFLADLSILIRTPLALLRGDGAR
jgi:lipopolysaccharide/colanic/teichoic acid biosynthesis glycosyltransferase